ncbi:MAG TPA: GxxExxY protein [Bacteroidia bacterium]|nr:GxxExxY protein [Bacteroidia bacterium]
MENEKASESAQLKSKHLLAEEELTSKIIGCALKVHTALGPGLLESAYLECLNFEIRQSGMEVRKQVAMPLIYNAVEMDLGYRVDLLVENKIILELKTVEKINDVHLAQLLTYMKLAKSRVGLLLNFHVRHMREGIKRVVL